MANLNDILTNAQGGQGIAMLGREFGLTPEQTQAAATALLPAISTGLKRATETPEGLANLLAVMGRQRDLHAMHDNADTAFGQEGRDAGNDVLSVIFGSPEVSHAVANRAQTQSGIGSSILNKLLPILVGMLISGMLGKKSSEAAPSGTPSGAPAGNVGSLWDILQQIFGRGMLGPAGTSPAPPQQGPASGGEPLPTPGWPTPRDAGGQSVPGGDLLEQILRELQKAIQDGRLKPVIIGLPMPGQQAPMPSGPPSGDSFPGPLPSTPQAPSDGGQDPQVPGADILSKIFRDALSKATGAGSRTTQAGLGSAVFGDRLEHGQDVDQRDLGDIERMFDQFFGNRKA